MTEHSSDEGVLKRIQRLVSEEQKLYQHGSLDDHAQVRLENLRVELD